MPIDHLFWLTAEGLVIFVLPLAFYLLPTLKGMFRPGVDLRRVALVNLFLGWTIVGWLVAIVMADGLTRPSHLDGKPFG